MIQVGQNSKTGHHIAKWRDPGIINCDLGSAYQLLSVAVSDPWSNKHTKFHAGLVFNFALTFRLKSLGRSRTDASHCKTKRSWHHKLWPRLSLPATTIQWENEPFPTINRRKNCLNLPLISYFLTWDRFSRYILLFCF